MSTAAPPTHAVRIYLDDGAAPIAEYDPPARFELDTERLADGPHKLRIEAVDEHQFRSVREIPFYVRNGPGIAVAGLKPGDVVHGKRSIIVNAYAGGRVEAWEPIRAETPAPIPTWAWVVCLVVVAWGMFYLTREWRPPAEFASTPTYSGWGAASMVGSRDTTRRTASAGTDRGAELYRVSCANCHQVNGEGLPGAFPPLAGDPVETAADPRPQAQIVLFGLSGKVINGVRYAAQMPPWGSQLSDDEIAAIMNYERTAWGNSAPLTTAQTLAAVRAQHGSAGTQ